MENYIGMRELVEMIFRKKSTIPEQNAAHSSIPSSFLAEDFPKKMREVLFFKVLVIGWRYQGFFAGHIQKVLSLHEEYLSYLMSICLRECEANLCIFDSFIGVCAFVTYISEQTFLLAGVNFLDLNPDIFMVFYQKVLKTSFLKEKGFYRFLEYIRTHKYLEWNRKKKGLTFVFDHKWALTVDLSLCQKINEESSRYRYFQQLPNDTKSSKKVNAISLAQEVLSNTSVGLSALPCKSDIIKRLVASVKKLKAKEAEASRRFDAPMTNETSHGNSSLNPDAKINHFKKERDDIARHEDTIQAVIRHNHSKNSDENASNQIPKEADRILEHLKNTIKSLTEVLDKCNKD